MKILEILNKTQEQLLDSCYTKLKSKKFEKIIKTDEYIFAKGNVPVLLVAHLDMVHKDIPEVYFDTKKGVLWSPTGIGGDDRCGVYAIFQVLEKYKPYVLLTTNEEIGGVGAKAFIAEIDKKLLKDVKYIIEIDRRGKNQAVFYSCDNKKFKNYVKSYGLEEHIGSFSDISVISEPLDLASVNLSAGYYNEHTNREYIVLDDLRHTINIVEKMLKDAKNVKRFKYCKEKLRYNIFTGLFDSLNNYNTKMRNIYCGDYNNNKNDNTKIYNSYYDMYDDYDYDYYSK